MDLVVARPEGLYCPPGDFHIDPWRPVPRAIVTHAHSDHARAGSGHYLCAAPGRRAQVVAAAGARMIGMGVGDDGPRHRAPRVDMEVARRAIQALGPRYDKVHGMRTPAAMALPMGPSTGTSINRCYASGRCRPIGLRPTWLAAPP